MMVNQTDDELPIVRYNNLAWGAVIAGVVVSLAYEILFNFLGVSLGLANTNASSDSMVVISSALTVAWLTISGVIAMGLGGWFTGRFCNVSCKFNRGCHGLLTWSVATLISVMLTASGTGLFLGRVMTETAISPTIISQELGLNNLHEEDNYSESKQPIPNDNWSDTSPAEALHDVAKSVSRASFVMFIGFLLSGVASIFGALCGGATKRNDKLG